MKKPFYKKYLPFLIIIAIILLILASSIIFIKFNKKDSLVFNQANESDRSNVINDSNYVNDSNTITPLPIPPIGNFKLTIKAPNPQYKSNQDISISYTIENTDNKTITIPKETSSGIEIKNSAGKTIEYAGSEPGIFLIKESAILNLSRKMNSNFVIQGSDYDLLQGGSSDGSYPVVTAFVGEVRSNRVILRIVK